MHSDELRTNLAKNIQRLRAAEGISQEQLASRAGLHRTYIGAVERAERNITLSTLQRIADALGVNPVSLLQQEEGEVTK